jgi:hypothetical protein
MVADDPFKDLLKCKIRMEGCREKARVRGETGICVHLEDPGATLFIDAEVDTGVTLEIEEFPASKRKLLQMQEQGCVRFRKGG